MKLRKITQLCGYFY